MKGRIEIRVQGWIVGSICPRAKLITREHRRFPAQCAWLYVPLSLAAGLVIRVLRRVGETKDLLVTVNFEHLQRG